MARASTVDPCLICGQLPCQCNIKRQTKRPARPRATAKPAETDTLSPKPTVKPTVEEATEPVVVRQSMLDRMRARAVQQPIVPPPAPARAKPTAASAELPELNLEQLAELAAVRTLSEAFEINPADLAPYQPYLDKPPAPGERSAAWKLRRQRNGGTTEGN